MEDIIKSMRKLLNARRITRPEDTRYALFCCPVNNTIESNPCLVALCMAEYIAETEFFLEDPCMERIHKCRATHDNDLWLRNEFEEKFHRARDNFYEKGKLYDFVAVLRERIESNKKVLSDCMSMIIDVSILEKYIAWRADSLEDKKFGQPCPDRSIFD